MRPVLIAFLEQRGFASLAPLIPTSGSVYVLLFLVCGWLLSRRVRESSMSSRHMINLWIVGGAGGAIGSRVYYLAIHGRLWGSPPSEWIPASGSASWGAYIGVALAITAYCAIAGVRPLPWLDIGATLQPIGEVIGRWACWLAGDDFGRVTTLPWGIRFPQGSLAWSAHLARGELAATAPWSLPVHPQQFYLMANAAVLALLIKPLWRRYRHRPGVTLGVYLMLYGTTRFVWEFFRDPAAGGAVSGPSSSQTMCLGYLFAGATVLLVLRATTSTPPPTAVAPA